MDEALANADAGRSPAPATPVAQRERSPDAAVPQPGKLLVAIAANSFSAALVQTAARLAEAFHLPWIAAYVKTSWPLAPDERRCLDESLALARKLGAEIMVTRDDDVAAAILRLGQEQKVTQLLVGRARGDRRIPWLRGAPLSDRLLEMADRFEIHVMPTEPAPAWKPRSRFDTAPRSTWGEYALALGVLAVVTGGGLLLPESHYMSVGLVYLLAVIALSLQVGRGPMLVTGILSALTWEYIFIPPHFAFAIYTGENLLLFITYFVVALIAGELTARIRAQAQNERLREVRATAMFQFTRALAEAKTLDEAASAGLRQIDDLFGAQATLALADESGAQLSPQFAGSFTPDASERKVADWVFQQQRPAGRGTAPYPASAGYYVPLLRENHAVGVLGVKLSPEETWRLNQLDILEAFARQLALIVEREHLRASSEREQLLAQSEKLHRTLLESVSHELRTPLAVITATSEELVEAGGQLPVARAAEIHRAAMRLNRLVGNLLTQTRLESGALQPRLDWCDARDLVNAAVANARQALGGHPLSIQVPRDMPLVRADFALTEQALTNLLLNAALHTKAGTPVSITAGYEPEPRRIFFAVADRGPGFHPSMRERLFKKFARGEGAHAGGLGLGLAIVHGFITAQAGEVIVDENPGGGARILLYLPYAVPENPPPE